MSATTRTRAGSVTARIVHALPNANGEPSYTYDGSFKRLPPGVMKRRNGESRSYTIEIHNARLRREAPSLMKNGFCLASDFRTSIDLQNRTLDSGAVVSSYYPLVSDLVVRALGGDEVVKRAIVFDHTIRSRARRAQAEKETNGENVGGYAIGAHNDNTSHSAKTRVRTLCKSKEEGGSVTLAVPPLTAEEAEKIATGRFAIFNVWRHFRTDYPVLDFPLAVLDAQSSVADDFQTTKYIYPHRVGEVVSVLRNPAHEWVYYPQMRHDEALIFKVFDSSAEVGVRELQDCPPNTAHTAFELPDTDETTPPRESIECRVLVEFVSG